MIANSQFFCKSTFVLMLLLLLYGCSSDDEAPVDCNAANLQATVSNILDATCGLDNGAFVLNVSGGTPRYELTLPGLGTQSLQAGNNTVENIPAGNYAITIRDGNNCMVTANVNISDVNNVTVETQIDASGCETTNGTITIAASGGSEPYMYSLDGSAMQTDNVFSGLGVGDYTALVSDAEGCETSITVSVLSGVSYNDEIIPIINQNCAISNCHDGSNGAVPNWTDLATVQANAENIKTRTSDGSMPPAGRPDLMTEEIQAIACWVDDGALDN